MRIRSVEASVLSFTLARPFRAAIRLIPTVDFVVAEVRTEGGITGLGYGFAFGRDDAAILAALVRTLGERAIGLDALEGEAAWSAMWDSLVFLGQSGPGVSAIAPIDIALWDIRGKAFNASLSDLLGRARADVPVYGSGGSLASALPDLVAEMEGYARAGWPAVKMKVGLGLAEDRRRIAAVRAAVGQDVRIIVDANQQWTAKEAVAAASAFAEAGIWWLEEPVPAARIEDCAKVREGAPVAIATGETNFTAHEFERMLRLRAADVLMPNLQRVGGITPWRKIAAASELAGVPVASHVYAEINAHLMAASPNGLTLEVIPWWPRLFEQELEIRGGRAVPPSGPGLGLTLDAGVVARHRVA